jgi:hypothetical protein
MTGILPSDPRVLAEMFNSPPAPASAPDELRDVFAAFEKEITAKAKAAELAQVSDAILHVVEARLEPFLPWINAETDRKKRSEETRRQYSADWRRFETWCREIEVPALPATREVVGLYLLEAAKRGVSVSWLKRARRAIDLVHELKFSPTRNSLVDAAILLAGEQRPATSDETEH